MKKTLFIPIIALCLFFGTMTIAASAYVTPESIVAAGRVYVSSVTYDPTVFFTDDAGTVVFEVTNGNTDQGVVVNHATLSETNHNIRLTSGTYDYSSNIGPGKTQTFTFSVKADGRDGTYYPTFSLSLRDADNLWYKTMVQIDNTPLVVTILDKPDAFTQGRKKTMNVQVANPRKNDVYSLLLEISGTGITSTPSKIFIGELVANANKTINVAITPDQPTMLVITVYYANGDNIHKATTELPIVFGTDKKQANPVVSNIQVKSDNGIYHVTGDVTNAGLETANAVMVTTLSPAVPQDPYRTYVVGALKPDDFGSFEVTFFAQNGSSIPIQLSYKDADGNIITSTYDVTLSSLPTSSQKSDLPILPIVVVVIIVGVFSGGWVIYLRRNKK
jgi:hypothetical protein